MRRSTRPLSTRSKSVWLIAQLVLGALAVFMLLAACSGAFMVVDYPVEASDAGTPAPVMQCVDDGTECAAKPLTEAKYWSAYVRLESRDLPKLWKAGRQDYVMISAKATIPTRKGKITRDFPLFLINEGQVQTRQGFDLLQRFPLSAASREQVIVQIEVKILRDADTLKTVRTILDEAEKAAEPYLSNFAVATKIVGTAVSIIDRLGDVENVKPSSAAFALDVQDGAAATPSLKAFLIFPFGTPRQGRKLNETSDLELLRNFDGELHECDDAAGMLCRGNDKSYTRARFRDIVYLTIKLVPYPALLDPAILVRGAAAHCSRVTTAAVVAAEQYLDDNEHLFALEDVDEARSQHALAREYLALREASAKKDLNALIGLLENEPGWQNLTSKEYKGMLRCWDAAWAVTPAVETWQVWSLYRTEQKCELATTSALRADLLFLALSKLARIAGRDFDPKDRKVWNGSAAPVLELLQDDLGELWRTLHGKDEKQHFSQNKWCGDPEATAKGISVYCEECWSALAATCTAQARTFDTLRNQRLAVVENLLEQVRCNYDGSLDGCNICEAKPDPAKTKACEPTELCPDK